MESCRNTTDALNPFLWVTHVYSHPVGMAKNREDNAFYNGRNGETQLLQRKRASAVITPFEVIQGHRFPHQLKAPYATSYTHLLPILYRFHDISQYLPYCRFRHGVACISLTHQSSVMPRSAIINNKYIPKTTLLAYIFIHIFHRGNVEDTAGISMHRLKRHITPAI